MSPPPADLDAVPGAIDLAGAPSFAVGALHVRPSTREVVGDGGEVVAEPRVLQVLITLVAAQGAVVSRDALVRRCWEGRVVGEDAINRSIAKVRALAELTRPPAFTVETIPRVGYRLRATPVVEATPSVPEPTRALGPRRRTLLIGASAAGAAVLVGGGLSWRRFGMGPGRDPLVAVLPFDNLSPDAELGFFADGLSEDILNALTRGGGLRVTARSSSFTFRGAAKARAGEALKAAYLLDGSVLREGRRLRVNAHLSEVKSGQTLWSDSYDRDLGQGLQLEDEVAGQVATALKVRLTSQGARLIDPTAYDLYLKGRQATREHTPEDIKRGGELLQQAVERSPDFSAAWFEVAKNQSRAAFLEPVPAQVRGFALGMAAAKRAVALDPRNAAAIGIQAELIPRFGRWAAIATANARALALSPNDPDLLLWRGDFLLHTGQVDAAVTILRRVVTLDPLELFPNHLLWDALNTSRRFAEAEARVDRIAAIWPTQVAAYWDRFWLLATSGRGLEAAAWLDRPNSSMGEPEERAAFSRAARALAGGSASERAAVGAACTRLARLGYGYAEKAMMLLAGLGQDAAALALARSIYLGGGEVAIDRGIEFISSGRYPQHGEPDSRPLFHPFLARLRRAGRLNPIFDGIGLTAFWREAGPPDA